MVTARDMPLPSQMWCSLVLKPPPGYDPTCSPPVRRPAVFFGTPPAADWCARTTVPSIANSRNSISSPLSCFTARRASNSRSHRPSRLHLQKRSYTVCQGPNRSGRFRQRPPSERIQRMSGKHLRVSGMIPWL
jgi:hypothetical protein